METTDGVADGTVDGAIEPMTEPINEPPSLASGFSDSGADGFSDAGAEGRGLGIGVPSGAVEGRNERWKAAGAGGATGNERWKAAGARGAETHSPLSNSSSESNDIER